MGLDFTNKTPASTYKSILTFQQSSGLVAGGIESVSDGGGIDSALKLGTSGVDIVSGFRIAGELVTAAADELNYLSAVTAGANNELGNDQAVVLDTSEAYDGKGATFTQLQLNDHWTHFFDHGSVSSSGDVYTASGYAQLVELVGSPVAFSFNCSAASGDAQFFRFLIRQDSTGGRAVTWPVEIDWIDGVIPELNTNPYDMTTFEFLTIDGGTTWNGWQIRSDFTVSGLTDLNVPAAPSSGDLLRHDGTDYVNVSKVDAGVVGTSGQTLDFIFMDRNESPDTNPATPDVRNKRLCLDFDGTTAESGLFPIFLPSHYNGGGIQVNLHWAAATATAGSCVWKVAFERMTEEGTDADDDSFATAVAGTGAAPTGSAGQIRKTSIEFNDGSAMDSWAAGEYGRLFVQRDPADGGDDMSGDAELYVIELKEKT